MIEQPCAPLVTPEDVEKYCNLSQFGDEPPSGEEILDAAAVASRVAWALGGRRHGLCPVTGERPGRPRWRSCCLTRSAYRWNGEWRNGCSCKRLPIVQLAGDPVDSIQAVRIGGVVLDPSAYHQLSGNRLIRRDGGSWPACQLLDEPDDAEDVLVVDYTWGVPVDPQGILAISELACELLKARPGSGGKCRLPERVTQVTRQGVTFVLLDPFDFLQEGRTGVYSFDLWISTVNPELLTQAPRVRSPDIARPIS